ncbi:carbohydrate ABC transporter substrate-binding protein, CUT1 family [Pseudooceanicola antarcticus]|uniref:Carbohydrate ABC transporter substrate-binding protein, CUT1 family n=1 Tax=Pseudooceanicola antarcticus TaxID=1247613 RepID=A0A285INF4_9RHOB|nr:extracellular solute-binding protein [Pseudooceanicola antarcticus]PJE29204.1 sugar ABC transporter [Pseudooceanicola antarcticus]SNY48616.1 carbohydrate ABC transporter substrate-binding protein, CUT1 family [Pseudooceanicola antarcticus]
MKLTRRTLLGTMGAAAAASALPFKAMAATQSIRHFWWGNPTRDERTFKVIEMFQGSHPDIAVQGETIGWGDYWTKMATQTAGGNMADVIQMAHTYIHEYVQRGGVVPLNDYIGNGIDLSHYDAGANDIGTMGGDLYGINIGATCPSIPYNKRVFEEAGVEFDPLAWTTDDFAAACEKITSSTGGAVTGSEDMSLYMETFEIFCRQAGVDFYSEDGELTMTVEQVAAWWQMWKDLRDAGVVEGKDATVQLDKGMADLGLIRGTTATTFRWANQTGALQGLMQDPLGLAIVPQRAGLQSGHFVLPSMFLCLTRDAGDIPAALAYIDNWVNDEETIKVLGIDRGIPPSQKGRDILAPQLNETDAMVVTFFGETQSQILSTPVIGPKGSGEVRDSFMRTGTEVVLGNMSPQDAADQFIHDAEGILIRASR